MSTVAVKTEAQKSNDWYVKGPMGIGIDINTDAHNIIFAGGTGILVPFDIIGMMIFSLHNREFRELFGPNFKVSLYYAVADEKEAVGLDMVEMFDKVCKQDGNDYFSLNLRMSSRKAEGPQHARRWDKQFLKDEFGHLKGNKLKFIISGSPLMNISLDRAFEEEIQEMLGLGGNDIEVM